MEDSRVIFFTDVDNDCVPGVPLVPGAEARIKGADEPITSLAALVASTPAVRAADPRVGVTRRDVFRALLAEQVPGAGQPVEALHAVYYVRTGVDGEGGHHFITIPSFED